MKRSIVLMILAIGMMVAMPPGDAHASPLPDQSEFVVDNPQLAPAALPQETGGVELEQGDPGLNVEVPGEGAGVKDFLAANWGYLLFGLLGLIELIVRWTPTKKDDSILTWVLTLLNTLLPNYKEGGGTFKVSSK